MVVGEGKRRRITVVLGCGRGCEGGFAGDEKLQYVGILGTGVGRWVEQDKTEPFSDLELRSELWFGVWELEGLSRFVP